METYGVSFAGFEPWCGQDTISTINEKVIPSLVENLNGYNSEIAGCKNQLKVLEPLRDAAVRMLDDQNLILKKFDEPFPGYGKTVREVCTRPKVGIDRDKVKKYLEWLETSKEHLDSAACQFMLIYECTLADLQEYEGIVQEVSAGLEFYRHFLEVVKINWIFDHADHKYRTKICREAVKELTGMIAKGEAYVQWMKKSNYEEDQSSNIRVAEKLIEQTRPQLKEYKRLKTALSGPNGEEAARMYDKFYAEAPV